MIGMDKDRFECLKAAIGLFQPKAASMEAKTIADHVVKAAEIFYEFVRGDRTAPPR